MHVFDQDILLENERALLRKRTPKDFEGTLALALDERIWKWYPVLLNDETKFKTHFDESLRFQAEQYRYTFTIIDKAQNAIAGSTTYQHISPKDKRLEIGWTWLGSDFQGTGLNANCKYLLLTYAFETLGCERIELKADVLNLPSVKAMEKIGATREGVLRSRMQMYGSRRRDTVYYSILKHEWPQIKAERFGHLSS